MFNLQAAVSELVSTSFNFSILLFRCIKLDFGFKRDFGNGVRFGSEAVFLTSSLRVQALSEALHIIRDEMPYLLAIASDRASSKKSFKNNMFSR